MTEQRRNHEEILRLNEQLRLQAETDFMTGLVSRRKFIDEIVRERERYNRYGDTFCLALLDLDKFKFSNDEHGHDFGDIVIRHFADHLRAHLRKIDIPGRIGGEEFAILLPKRLWSSGGLSASELSIRRSTRKSWALSATR